ncbi:PP2C family protein-serine/threonine phosphatase [Marisediminicola sp. LYQ134]|uniref:PP2C family protein-serine/threonine phosphatase n=1 Tax=unclassified Marisediminicola TaxID=2618316 RepID=UPI00398368D4
MTQIGRSGRHTLTIPGTADDSLSLSWGSATDIGRKRQLNEDSYLAQSPFFVVADGMGGHSSGDVASRAVVTRLSQVDSKDFAEPEEIFTALKLATEDIALAADDDDRGVGTTATGAVLTVHGGEAYWAVFNIGDSRVYQFENGELKQVTVDHSVVQELVDAGLISKEDAEFHPDSNVITRAVGFNALPVADLWMIPVRAGLRLLVCSDGLTREVDDDEIADLLAEGPDPQDAAEALVAAALESGGRDNITSVVVDIVSSVSTGEFELENTLPKQTPSD